MEIKFDLKDRTINVSSRSKENPVIDNNIKFSIASTSTFLPLPT